MSDPAPTAPADVPVDPLFTHPASPFERTNPPSPLAFPSPPMFGERTLITPLANWNAYRTQIEFGFAILAYLMFLVGSVTVVAANPSASWRYWVAVLPAVPAGVIVGLTVRHLRGLDEVAKRTQMEAIGFALAATGLVTFGYGFFEGAGLPHMNPAFVLPLTVLFWLVAFVSLYLRGRIRR